MTQIFQWLNRHWLAVAVTVFVVTRLSALLNLPGYIRYFEEYANIWYYGMPPYLQHWFEYPPATIPFISLPLYLDQWGWGVYRWNFITMMLAFDGLLFGLVALTVKKTYSSNLTKLVNLIFYALVTAKAKDFLYENLDLIFTLTLFLPAVAPLLFTKGRSWLTWLAYWLGIGIKLINAPLAAAYQVVEIVGVKNWRDWIAKIWIPILSFLVIWAWPLLLYRTALSVIIVYHQNRTLQAESLPAMVVRAINMFTQTETIYLSNYKSYDLQGPISDRILPLSMVGLVILMLIWLGWVIKNRHHANQPLFLMKSTLIFLFSYLAANKVFSTQYHLWYIPLIAVYPYTNQKQRALMFGLAALYLGVATTKIPQIQLGSTDWATLIPVLTQIPAGVLLLVYSYGLPLTKLGR